MKHVPDTPAAPARTAEPLTREGLHAYFVDFLNGERGEASAEVLTDVVLLAVHEEREAIIALFKGGAYCRYVDHAQDFCGCEELEKDIRARSPKSDAAPEEG